MKTSIKQEKRMIIDIYTPITEEYKTNVNRETIMQCELSYFNIPLSTMDTAEKSTKNGQRAAAFHMKHT